MAAVVCMKSVFQHVNGRCVLEGINLVIEESDSFALLGLNGAGKTLLLRLIMGLDVPSAGRIELFGQNLAELSLHERIRLRRSVGMVVQGGSLLNGLTVLENLMLPLRESRLSVRRIQRAARLIMTQMRLDGMENLKPYELSGGVRRKVELARALIHRPPLLLWDELLDGLDSASVVEIQKYLEHAKETYNMSLVFTTHRTAGTLSMASRVGVLANGQLLFNGSLDGLTHAKQQDVQLRYAVDGLP